MQPARIILAEDDPSLVLPLTLKLQNCGLTVDHAKSGPELLSLLGQNIYALILLDLIMPDTDGFATIATIRESGNQTPIIVLSNLSAEEDITRAKESGAQAYLIKSNTSLSEIAKRIEEFLQSN